MSKYEIKLRCLTIIRILSTRRYGVSAAELAKETGVSYRTIQRDIVDFQNAGLPIEHDVGDFGRKSYRLSSLNNASQIVFRYDEALALYMSRRFMEPLAGTYFWEGCQSAFQKIRAICGDKVLEYLQSLANRIHITSFGTSDYSAKAEVIDTLTRCIEDSIQVIITYQPMKATEPVEYSIDPYGMVYHQGSLYVVAYSHDSKAIRHFKVNRVHEIEPSHVPFERPHDFDIAKHLEQTFGIFQGSETKRIVVRFRGLAAQLVKESTWHQAQKIVAEGGGSVVAEFELSATEEVKKWILGFGRRAEVLSPESLRQEIVDELRELLSVYEREPTISSDPDT